MRHAVLAGSATAILLLGAIAAFVWHHGGPTDSRPTNTQASAPSQAPADPRPAPPQPPRPVAPSFDIVKVGPTGTAIIAGRAEPGSKVTVRDGDKIIGEVTADGRGEWVLVPEEPIGAGDRLLSLEAPNAKTGAVAKSDETVALSVAPSASGGAETALAVALPRDGDAAARVLQRPEGASTAHSDAPSIDSAQYDAEGRLALSGHAKPGATVQIYRGDQQVATVTADAAGGWSTTSARAAGDASLDLRLDQLDASGQVAQSVTLPLPSPDPVPGQNYVVQRGNSLWQIARRGYGAGLRYVVIYSANLEQIRDPDRIYPGQVFKLPKKPGESG